MTVLGGLAGAWPMYEALDGSGRPFERPSRTVSELPHELRAEALLEVGQVIEGVIGMPFLAGTERLHFGLHLWRYFFLTQREAVSHPQSGLLMQSCGDLPLSLLSLSHSGS